MNAGFDFICTLNTPFPDQSAVGTSKKINLKTQQCIIRLIPGLDTSTIYDSIRMAYQ